MNKNVGIKLCLEFENAADLKEFSDTVKQFIPDFLETPITVGSDNTLSMTTVAYDHQVSTFLQACMIIGDGFEKLKSAKNLLDSIESFRDKISRLSELHPDEYRNKTIIQNVDGHSVYNGELTEDEVLSIIDREIKNPKAFYINGDGDIKDILEI